MKTLEDLKVWMQALDRFGSNIGDTVLTTCSVTPDEPTLRFELFTDNNRYSIKAIEKKGGGSYLGCTASSRKPRAGEDWTRGRDLADGALNHTTWVNILSDIVSYELVKIHSVPNIYPVSVAVLN